MSCSHYGIPLAPLVANQSHIRAGSVYISNPVDGLETGGHFSLKTICLPGFVREDGQIHPNILFGNCRLLKKIHPFWENTLKLSAMAGKRDNIKSVVFTPASWHHIYSKHSITETNTFRSLSNRAHTTARDDEKLSVFIHKDFTRGKKTLFTKMLTVNNDEKEVIDFDPRLQGPFTCLVAGPTGCGKTQLIFKLIENTAQLITPTVHNIVYCYGQWQKDFKKYDNKVNFHEGLIPREQIFPVNSQESSTQHTLLIIDDLLGKEDTSLVRDIFIKGSHHNNISVIFVTQNLFLPHKDYRTLSLNAHYLVIFKNPRDMSQINALARQAFASKPTFLTAVYNRETSDRHSYLLLDFKQSTPELMRVRDSITTPWKTTVFVPTYK